MSAIFPSTALRADQAAVKRAADQEHAIVTDNNGQHYLFFSEGDFDQTLSREAAEAAYIARIEHRIERSRRGIAHGEFVVGAEAAIAKAKQIRAARG